MKVISPDASNRAQGGGYPGIHEIVFNPAYTKRRVVEIGVESVILSVEDTTVLRMTPGNTTRSTARSTAAVGKSSLVRPRMLPTPGFLTLILILAPIGSVTLTPICTCEHQVSEARDHRGPTPTQKEKRLRVSRDTAARYTCHGRWGWGMRYPFQSQKVEGKRLEAESESGIDSDSKMN